MGNVIWCRLRNDKINFCPNDLIYLCDQIDDLDKICIEANVKGLTNFLDDTDLKFNLNEELLDNSLLQENVRWFDPLELMTTVDILIESDDLDDDIYEEIESIKERCETAIKTRTQIRLLILM